MAVNYLANVQKLLGRENYEEWAFAMQNLLLLDGYSNCLDGSETDEEKKQKAKAKLVLSIDPSLFVHIKDATTAEDLWKKLRDLYADTGFTRKINLLRTLISLRLESCDSMDHYVNQVIETAQRLRKTGFNIDDEWIGSLLLAGLPERFSPMIMAIEHSGIKVDTDSIKNKLLDMQVENNSNGGAFASKPSKPIFHQGHPSRETSNQANNYKKIKCYRCNQLGHFKNKCPNQNNAGSNSSSQKRSNAFSAIFLNGVFDKKDWYIDSGASVHLTTSDQWLEETKTPVLKTIMVANRTEIPVFSCGKVKLQTSVGKHVHDVTVQEVFHVPDLATNLLSVSQLIKNGNRVVFAETNCKVYNSDNELIATADLVQNVYKLNVANNVNSCFAISETASSEIWHRRFGHLNYNFLNKTKTLVTGLECNENFEKTKACIVCCEGKQTRLPFASSKIRASTLLEVVHADVCGPMEVKSLGGSRYFLLLQDDCSRMLFVYFLKSKDQVFEMFKLFKAMAENQTNRKVKCLRSDNGGEFCNQNFEAFLQKSGILHQKTNPYTPEQNGMIERMNRTIVEKSRCLLFDANLKKELWAEAVNTSVYLYNRSSVSGIKTTPFEAWTGQKPNVANFRVFGSKVMCHIPKEKRHKWDKKSKQMVLVGYGDQVKGYRLYDSSSNEVITSRDVIIMETKPQNFDFVYSFDQEQSDVSDSVGDQPSQQELSRELETDTDVEEVAENSILEDYDDPDFIPDNENQVRPDITELRRSDRQSKRPRNLDDYVIFLNGASEDTIIQDDPLTVEEALSRPDKLEWQKAMEEELECFEENQTWDLVDVPKEGTVVGCKWVFKRKYDADNVVTYRARLVAKGFSQKYGVDFNETFAPVVRHSSLRLLIALSVKLDLIIYHFDVKTAFLNGILKENVYMEQPVGFENVTGKVLKLNKAVYGLKQASRAWNERIDIFLTEHGYKKSEIEPCIYFNCSGDIYTIIALYVDDFFVFSNDKNNVSILKSQLSSEFKIKDLGEARKCLGMNITRDLKTGTIFLDQKDYVNQILRKFNFENCNSVKTPLESNLELDEISNSNVKYPYQNLVGSLMYLAVLTRPDIAFSVSYLSQYNSCYSESHWKCAKRVLRYLQGTKNLGLKFEKEGTSSYLEGFVDADWATCKRDRRSYTGYVFKLCGSAVSWESCKQRTVALSSAEAEYMALSDACKEALYLKNLFFELTNDNECIVLHNDNQSAQKLAVNPIVNKRTKHIDTRHHFIRELISNKLINIKYMPTNEMIADVLTKGLSAQKHYYFINGIGVKPL